MCEILLQLTPTAQHTSCWLSVFRDLIVACWWIRIKYVILYQAVIHCNVIIPQAAHCVILFAIPSFPCNNTDYHVRIRSHTIRMKLPHRRVYHVEVNCDLTPLVIQSRIHQADPTESKNSVCVGVANWLNYIATLYSVRSFESISLSYNVWKIKIVIDLFNYKINKISALNCYGFNDIWLQSTIPPHEW